MLILGVDPGALRGAYSVLDASGSLLEVADLPKVADHKTRWVDAPVLLSRRLEIKPVATLRRRIPSSIATTRHSGGAGRFRIMNRIASSSSGLNGPSNTTSCALILPMNERVCSTTFFASSIVIVLPPGRPVWSCSIPRLYLALQVHQPLEREDRHSRWSDLAVLWAPVA